ncbi:hypothetical protein ABB37_09661 [Leptomonas pyrrhocoris]|uniref:Uncharacterized protein n=1 Tax=Leptomonas pyrrhocoris TaxID=157538 RepID=A0A0M9FQC8_LEPPY|nr:hypothetical protein ABB37_09661 [Leptomonas pyrrhocoris]XP_015652209.1 hypothetical protein ABB37_09661 [Leptomonas pyrrhocoris]XP_015652210.1 hypothetical protein ABB37_09661 [Leptomonas pyrrhocoris]XP_015652211.1 hypothetical protein ABB37_09661 [Leptomonas pyrrhocoris]KPA73769.1 hypothetical protein ABB37_09661 [Leptomonas pyrrhocoris]KPA73770.1 hypothetical protein ABB37_09661 [Leptomonas pyrrhocoris]KPA73771.1 hypothetical protein ABB37_09661 [Leptomonas pyrrhocoris]KPA73772.1 hypot|eukprot:XP_015652208.1 hypothetical protein ABB37_09661 [Leptomonas pyrrhocoris]
MSAHPSSSPSSDVPRSIPPSQQSAAGVPSSAGNPIELHGVPIAYRQSDGSEQPAVIEPSHPPGDDPSAERRLDPLQQQQRQYPEGNSNCPSASGYAAASPPAATVERVSASPSATRHTPYPAAGVVTDERELDDERRRQPPPGGAGAPAVSNNNSHLNNKDDADSSHSTNATGKGSADDTAGVTYNSVAKPVFSPFQELRARGLQREMSSSLPQQQQQQQPSSPYNVFAPAYALAYAQPISAYGGSPPYAPNTPPAPIVVVPTAMNYQAQLYSQQQQQPYMMPYPQLTLQQGLAATAAATATADSQRVDESPYWETGLFGLNLDPLASIDAFVCGYCVSSAHFNVIYREEQGMFAPMIAGLFCVDCFCFDCLVIDNFWVDAVFPLFYPWSALALHTFVIRREVRRRYGIRGNPFIVKNGDGNDGDGGAHPARDVTVAGADAATPREGAQNAAVANQLNPSTSTRSSTVAAAAAAVVTPTAGEALSSVAADSTPKARPEQPERFSTDAAPSTTTAAATAEATPPQPAPTESTVADAAAAPSRSLGLSELQRVQWLECGADALISAFCTPCAIAQHHREMSLRGEWPGKVVFSRECFCGAREQLPSVTAVTSMF